MAATSISTIEKKITETNKRIEESITIENDVLRGLTINELNHRLQELEAERLKILNAQTKETIKLRLFGEEVETGRISVRVLSTMLEDFQKLADSIANAVVHRPTSAGRIPEYVKQLTDFQMIDTFAGSFGVVLEKDYEQVEIRSDYSQINQILNEMFLIMENSSDSNELLSQISPYGKRTISNYRDWLQNIKNSNVNLDIDWIDDSAKTRRMQIMASKIDSILYTLGSIESIEDEETVLTGILTGLNVRNLSFEMNSDSMGLVKGKAKMETLVGITDSIGHEITAKLIKNTTRTATGVEQFSWYLQSVS